MPLTIPCEFCDHTVNTSTDNFTKIELRNTVYNFAFALYRNLFHRFGFHYNLSLDYNLVRDKSPYTDQIEESVWGLSYVFRDYYHGRFHKLFPYFFNSYERYRFYIKSFCKQLFREHVCAFKLLVFCGFLSELSAFCHRRAMENALNDTAWHLEMFFNDYISEEFYAKVGWRKLQRTAELVSIGYRRMQNKIDFDPKIEKHFYSWDQVVNSHEFLQLQEEPWIAQTAKYLCLLIEDLDIFHISSANASDAETEQQDLQLTADDSEIQQVSKRSSIVQDAECKNLPTESIQTDFENKLDVQTAELNLQLAEGPEKFKIRRSWVNTSGANDVEETLLYFAEYIQKESKNEEFQGTVPSFRIEQDIVGFDESKSQNDDFNMQLAEYIGEIRKDLDLKRNMALSA